MDRRRRQAASGRSFALPLGESRRGGHHNPMNDAVEHLMTIFSVALDCGTEEERGAYLNRACADHPGLRERVEALIRAYARGGNFLGVPPINRTVSAGPVTAAVPGPRSSSGRVFDEELRRLLPLPPDSRSSPFSGVGCSPFGDEFRNPTQRARPGVTARRGVYLVVARGSVRGEHDWSCRPLAITGAIAPVPAPVGMDLLRHPGRLPWVVSLRQTGERRGDSA